LLSVRPGPRKTFFETAKSSFADPVFTAYLPYNNNGLYTFGTIDVTKFTSTLAYAPVNSSNGYWEFDSSSYMVGSTAYNAIGVTGFAGMKVTPYFRNLYGCYT
jgi:aspergillopepsin I